MPILRALTAVRSRWDFLSGRGGGARPGVAFARQKGARIVLRLMDGKDIFAPCALIPLCIFCIH